MRQTLKLALGAAATAAALLCLFSLGCREIAFEDIFEKGGTWKFRPGVSFSDAARDEEGNFYFLTAFSSPPEIVKFSREGRELWRKRFAEAEASEILSFAVNDEEGFLYANLFWQHSCSESKLLLVSLEDGSAVDSLPMARCRTKVTRRVGETLFMAGDANWREEREMGKVVRADSLWSMEEKRGKILHAHSVMGEWKWSAAPSDPLGAWGLNFLMDVSEERREIYVAEPLRYHIRVFDFDGNLKTEWGTGEIWESKPGEPPPPPNVLWHIYAVADALVVRRSVEGKNFLDVWTPEGKRLASIHGFAQFRWKDSLYGTTAFTDEASVLQEYRLKREFRK